MKKQTAVDWLIEQIKFIDKEVHATIVSDLSDQARQMMREQIEDTWRNGFINGVNSCFGVDNKSMKEFASDYFEQNYGE